MSSQTAPLRVSMMVWNTFQNDARVRNEAETLVQAGHRVTVFALHAPQVTAREETVGNGVHVRRVGRTQGRRLLQLGKQPRRGARPNLLMMALSRLGTHLALLFRMLQSRPDVVHAHDVNVLPTCWIAARLCRAKLVYDAHEISTGREGYQRARKLVGAIERRLMRAADATITTTDMRAKFFARAYGIPRPLVLQNRPRLIEPARTDRIRQQLQLNEPWPIILYQGGLQPGRGLEDLVQSAAEIPDIYVVFVGGGQQAPALREMAAAANLTDRVHFIDTVSLADLPTYTASADIGVQPIRNTCMNHWTTDSNKLFEYAMAGLPVIASDLPEVRRIVVENGLGDLFDADEPGSLTKALDRVSRSPELRESYRSNAIEHRAALSWEAQEQALVELYAGLSD